MTYGINRSASAVAGGALALLLAGCVTEAEVARLETEVRRTEAECKRIEKGLQVADGSGVWRTGERPKDLAFNLPNGECVEMSGIPCGVFIMGTPQEDGHAGHDCIGHKVTLTEPFWMARYPVTMAQAKLLLPEPEGVRNFLAADPKMQLDKFDPDWPEDKLTWNDANRIVEEMNRLFAGSLPDGYRFSLPTEAQWEYACRAGTQTAFNNGKPLVMTGGVAGKTFQTCANLDEVGWYSGNGGFQPRRAGLKKPNAWNLYDMHGLVSEWCRDRYSDALERASVNMINPKGPDRGKGHVVRGGTRCGPPDWAVSYWRDGYDVYPDIRGFPAIKGKPMCVGMRIALVKEAPEAPDLEDRNVYGKNYRTDYAWATNQLAVIDRRYEEVARPINEKAKYLPLLKGVAVALEILEPAIEIYVAESIAPSGGLSAGKDETASGWGTIRGPSSLCRGRTATYTLHVGGRKITSGVTWEPDGTSISAYSAGDHGRVQAGNPPIRSGHFRSGVRARYGGRTFRKTIQIYK